MKSAPSRGELGDALAKPATRAAAMRASRRARISILLYLKIYFKEKFRDIIEKIYKYDSRMSTDNHKTRRFLKGANGIDYLKFSRFGSVLSGTEAR